MAFNFHKYVADGEHFVKEVAVELQCPGDTGKAGSILRAVLHAFRNRVPPGESLQLIAQLPMLIKAVYVDGWQMKAESRTLRHLGDLSRRSAKPADGGPRRISRPIMRCSRRSLPCSGF
ncbi:MAG: DUF2267 domain-containing protein [Lewinellaceae bacterium]|nr:DUF2267 domain-containing protein [Lewinellaceae bacterium]